MKNVKNGQLVVIIGEVSDCGCSTVEKGTIAKVIWTPKKLTRGTEIEIQFCPEECTVWVNSDKDIRALLLKERPTAKAKYEKANQYNYAAVD